MDNDLGFIKKFMAIYGVDISARNEVDNEDERSKKEKIAKAKKYQFEFEEVRPLILERDNNKCNKCGRSELLDVHHIVYRSAGGTNEPSNLLTLCAVCHAEEHKGESIYPIMALRIKRIGVA